MSDDDAWFAPKRFGYGAGLPIAWQGWAVLGGYIGAVVAASVLARSHPYAFIATTVAVTVALLPVLAAHTRGGWRWRWGDDA